MILHSKIYGENIDKTPLLVLHGLFGMLDNWASFGRLFGEMLPCHLLDLRNHGKSFHSEEMSLQDLAEDILFYLNENQLTKINILGHSLGGKVAMQFALSYPHLVEKLIVVDIAPKSYSPHHQGIFETLQSVDFFQIKSRKEVEKILSQKIIEKSVVQFLAKNLYWETEGKLNWRFNLKVLSEKYSDYVSRAVRFGSFEGETLFIRGEKSQYILPQDELLISQQFPQSKIETISNAGHWVQVENPIVFNEKVREFLT